MSLWVKSGRPALGGLIAVIPQPDEPMAESLLDRGARLIGESKRLLFDLDAMARGGEPDAIKSVEPS